MRRVSQIVSARKLAGLPDDSDKPPEAVSTNEFLDRFRKDPQYMKNKEAYKLRKVMEKAELYLKKNNCILSKSYIP